jgi:hypothetical protein
LKNVVQGHEQYFLDSSALIKRYVVEPGTTWVRSLTNRDSGNTVIIAQITQIEIVSGASRRVREGTLTTRTARAVRLLIDRHVHREYVVIGLTPQVVRRAEDLLAIIGKYLSGLRKLNPVSVLPAGFKTHLRAACLPIPFGMCALGMTREICHSRLQRLIESCHVPGPQGLDNVAQDMPGTHRHLACGHGHRAEQLRHVGQKSLEGGGGNRRPAQPLDNGDLGRLKGMQIGIRFPCFAQPCSVPFRRPLYTQVMRRLRREWGVTRF